MGRRDTIDASPEVFALRVFTFVCRANNMLFIHLEQGLVRVSFLFGLPIGSIHVIYS